MFHLSKDLTMNPTRLTARRTLNHPALHLLWSNRLLGLLLTAGMAAGVAGLAAWLTPRGPITTSEALTWMGIAFVLGLASGLVLGSRWSALVTPAVFVLVFEVARLGVDSPTVDVIHLTSMYGLIAFGVGRLLHAVLVLAPMVVGSLFGVWWATRLCHPSARAMGVVGWGLTGLVTLALILLAVSIARPASTAPILGEDGAPLPGSIAELTTTPIGGHEQALMIRGRSTDNPVLLYLAGGPGGTDIGAMRLDTSLESHFVVVTWEQRGVGKSYAALEPVETLTVDQMVADTIAVTNYLRQRFDEEKIYLVGNSWGTTLGVLTVQQRPDLFHAYVGTGQMVSQRETDIIFYEETLTWAEATGNIALADTLRRNGPPPYDSVLHYEAALSHEHGWNPYPDFNSNNEMPAILFVPENTLMDMFNGFRSFLDTFAVLYPQLQQVDFRQDVPSLEVPVTVVLGEHETRGRAEPAHEWFDMLDAPSKQMIIVERAGHRAHFDDPAAFTALMARIVDETYTGSGENVLPTETTTTETTTTETTSDGATAPSLSLDNAADVAVFFDELISRQLAVQHIAGATVSVVRGSDVVFARGYGYADLAAEQPVTADRTLFFIGSDGKLFTWTAVMQLVEQGKLDLHADVNTYLDFAIPHAFEEPITLHHLMTHTAGFEDDLSAMMVDPQAHLPLRDFLMTHMPQPVYPPGEVFAYSNYGTALAGYIIERVSGEPFEAYITTHLLEPLGMTHSAAVQPLPSHLAADMSNGYRYATDSFSAADFEWTAAAPTAPIRGTSTDIARFLVAHLNDGCVDDVCILQAETVAQMHQQHFTHDPALTGMAYGFMEATVNGRRVLWHLGESARFSTLLAILPEEKAGLLVSYNTHMPAGRDVLVQFVDAFFPTDPIVPTAQGLSGWAERAALLQGTYISSRTPHSSPQKLVGWLSALPVQPEGSGILNVGNMRYVEVEPGLFRQDNGDRTLTYRQDGDQLWLFWGPFAYFKVPWYQTPMVHLGLVILCTVIFVLSWILGPVAIWRSRRHQSAPTKDVQIGIGLTAALGLLNLGLLTWFVLLMLNYSATLVYPSAAVAFITRLYWLAVPLTASILLVAVWSWVRRESHWGWRLYHLTAGVAGVAFVWFLTTWNLLAGLSI
ncbi:alpha/beta fold hydrolase [bacterium]|nr:alpha/beta fold hydrolase [bacterium]